MSPAAETRGQVTCLVLMASLYRSRTEVLRLIRRACEQINRARISRIEVLRQIARQLSKNPNNDAYQSCNEYGLLVDGKVYRAHSPAGCLTVYWKQNHPALKPQLQ